MKKIHKVEKITDLKDMFNRAAIKYAQRPAYMFKTDEPDKFKKILYKEFKEDVDELKTQIDDISEPLNYYNPNIEYDYRKSDGSVINYGVTVNNDGSVSYTRYANQSGQILLKSKDSSNILKAGTYTLSARVTIDDGITLPVAFYEFQTRVGFQSEVFTARMKTERGGNVNAEGRTGWVSATFTLAEDGIFAFEVMPKRAVADDDHPVIIDYIMINAGEYLAEYSVVSLVFRVV